MMLDSASVTVVPPKLSNMFGTPSNLGFNTAFCNGLTLLTLWSTDGDLSPSDELGLVMCCTGMGMVSLSILIFTGAAVGSAENIDFIGAWMSLALLFIMVLLFILLFEETTGKLRSEGGNMLAIGDCGGEVGEDTDRAVLVSMGLRRGDAPL